jgi:hypothetical protein
LKIETIDFKRLERKENKRLNQEMFRFKTNLALRKFRRKVIPRFMIIAYLNSKFALKDLAHEMKYYTSNAISSIKDKGVRIKDKAKGAIKNLASKLSKIISSIAKRFAKKKESKKAKSEEEELLDKILNKEEAD